MIKRRNRRAARTVETEALEQRTLLTAGLTVSRILYAQTADSNIVQDLMQNGRLGMNAGTKLQVKYDAYIAAASAGKSDLAAKKLFNYEERVGDLLGKGVISEGTAERLLDLATFDRDHGDFDILRQAVIDSGNISLLNRFNGNYTVFAPTDRAFLRLADNLGSDAETEAGAYEALVGILGADALNSVVQYHVVRGQRAQQWLTKTDYEVGDIVEFNDRYYVATDAHTSTKRFQGRFWDRTSYPRTAPQQNLNHMEVARAPEIETFGGTITPSGFVLQDAERDLPDARMLTDKWDIPAKNGIIHPINQVMIPDADLIVPPTILETVAESGGGFDSNKADYDILLNTVVALGSGTDEDGPTYADILGDPDADLTVLAPNDRAFVGLANRLGYEGSDESGAFDFIVAATTEIGGGDPIPVLEAIIQYHVLPGEQSVEEIIKTDAVTTLGGATFRPKGRVLRDNDSDIADPKIIQNRSEIFAENGIIHTLNRVLIPIDLDTDPTIGDVLDASDGEDGPGFDSTRNDFDILAAAVDAAGLTETFANPDAELTVFAPTDNAFINLAQELGFDGVDEEGAFDAIVAGLADLNDGNAIPLLTDILLYHVAEGEVKLESLDAGDSVETLNGASFRVASRSRLVDNEPGITNGRINTERSNVMLENGVVHVISRVLLPTNL